MWTYVNVVVQLFNVEFGQAVLLKTYSTETWSFQQKLSQVKRVQAQTKTKRKTTDLPNAEKEENKVTGMESGLIKQNNACVAW